MYCDLPGPAQGLQYLGQVHVTGYPEGLWRGDQGYLTPPPVLGEAKDCGTGRRVIRSTLPRRERGYPGQPTVAHHFQYGGRRGGSPLGIPAGGGTGGTGGGRKQRWRRRRGKDSREEDPGLRQ